MLIRRSSVLGAILLAALSTALHAEVVVAFDEANVPYGYSMKNGQPGGLYPPVFQEAFSRMGVKVKLVFFPWRRALRGLDYGDHGVGGIYLTSERAARYDYSKAYYEERLAVYSLKSTPLDFKGIPSLTGKRVAVLGGWSYGERFDQAVKDGKITTDVGASDLDNFQRLLRQRVDAVIASEASGEQLIRAEAYGDRVAKATQLLAQNPVYLAFARTAKQTELLARFDKAIASMKADGSFDRLEAKHLK